LRSSERVVEGVRESRCGRLDDPRLERCRYWGCTIGEGYTVISVIGGKDVVTVALDIGDETIEKWRCVDGLDVDSTRTSVDTVFDGTYLNSDDDVESIFKCLSDFLCRGRWRSMGDDEIHGCFCVCFRDFFISIFFCRESDRTNGERICEDL